MREIKFRAWDKNKMEMKEFTFKDIHNTGENPFIKIRGNYCMPKRTVWMLKNLSRR